VFINAGARLLCTSDGVCVIVYVKFSSVGAGAVSGGGGLLFILGSNLGGVGQERGLRGGGRRGVARTILLFHIISARPSKHFILGLNLDGVGPMRVTSTIWLQLHTVSMNLVPDSNVPNSSSSMRKSPRNQRSWSFSDLRASYWRTKPWRPKTNSKIDGLRPPSMQFLCEKLCRFGMPFSISSRSAGVLIALPNIANHIANQPQQPMPASSGRSGRKSCFVVVLRSVVKKHFFT
jgi:hypothetical protein